MPKKEKRMMAIKAGTTSGTREPWVDARPNILNYNDYMGIVANTIRAMKNDLDYFDREEFINDMGRIMGIGIDEDLERPINPDLMLTPKLRVRDFAADKQTTVEIEFESILEVESSGLDLFVRTNQGQFNFIVYDLVKDWLKEVPKDLVNAFLKDQKIQYGLYNFQDTVKAVGDITSYAQQHGIFVPVADPSDRFVHFNERHDLFAQSQDDRPNNVIDFNDRFKKR
ncbi:hypothetical protein IV38_GL001013 [Lactobacillus selangorensis]|uniref:Uncharacterized protein n=1 Tax=Lactobacillus selangorensis TaxID=81857 RepID=A0A0R2FXU9_9LACO|nr:hypothetical protein [Lactobacillus selangorensis]KRN28808.1 hypothetical protein IV38_GL001013 [Lactobacillus selangorensis]KRN32782.1 hypothetical protein IV40_GL000840 [Lactobacillus selangorensis]